MAGIRDALRQDFQDLDFAEGYAESFLNSFVATQIKVLREQRGLTQEQLAGLMGTSQAVISRAENVNYSAWTLGTLKRLARALGVRVHVSFETFGSLIDQVAHFSRPSLERPSFAEDPILLGTHVTSEGSTTLVAQIHAFIPGAVSTTVSTTGSATFITKAAVSNVVLTSSASLETFFPLTSTKSTTTLPDAA